MSESDTATTTPTGFLANIYPANADQIVLRHDVDLVDGEPAPGTFDPFDVTDADGINAFVEASPTDVIAYPLGDRSYGPACLPLWFPIGEGNPAKLLKPGALLSSVSYNVLVYLVDGDKAEVDRLIDALMEAYPDELNPDVPVPGRSWSLDASSDFRRCTIDEMRKQLFEPELSAEEPESEEALRARLKDKLKNGNPNPAQTLALKLAGRGFTPIPVHGVRKAKETKELECTCQSGKRWRAEKSRKTPEVCPSPGKHPAVEGWEQHNASRDPNVIMHLFAEKYHKGYFNSFSIGIVTGPETGVVVLDVDGPEGLANLARLLERYGPLPESVSVVTGSGGLHIYWHSPAGVTILNSMSKISPNIDFRGEHGFVVAPPSKHIKGGSYKWKHSPDNRSLAEMPDWLIKLAVEGGEKEAVEKGSKGSKLTGRKQRSADRAKAQTASTNTKGWQGYLEEMGDHEGGRSFNGPIGEAMCSYFRKYGHDADETEFLEAYAPAFERANKSKGGRGKYHPDHTYFRDQLDSARMEVRDTPSEAGTAEADYPIRLTEEGWVEIEDGHPFFYIAPHQKYDWIWGERKVGTAEKKGKKGDTADGEETKYERRPCCRNFKVLSYAKDRHGSSTTITIGYDTRNNGWMEVTFPKDMIADPREMRKLLLKNDFPMEDQNNTLYLFAMLDFRMDTLQVESPGWYDQGLLFPSGEFLAAPDETSENDEPGDPSEASKADAKHRRSLKLRLRNQTQGDWSHGNLDDWKAAVARIFNPEKDNLDFLAFGLFTGAAGLVASFINTTEAPSINLSGDSRHGKTTSTFFGASISAAPTGEGTVMQANGTVNALEFKVARRSGTSVYIDEVSLIKDPKNLGGMYWRFAQKSMKARMADGGSMRPDVPVHGMLISTIEREVFAKLQSEDNKEPEGLRSRLLDVSYEDNELLEGDDFETIFGREIEETNEDGKARKMMVGGCVEGIEENYGQAWRPITEHLMKVGRNSAAAEVASYAKRIDPKASGIRRAQTRIMALVWYAGEIMKEIGLIPDHADVQSVIVWAWDRMGEGATVAPFDRAMTNLLENSTFMRGKEIVKMEDAERASFQNRLGYVATESLLSDEYLLVPSSKGQLPELCGMEGKSARKIAADMKKANLLTLNGKKEAPTHSRLPNGLQGNHYKIHLKTLQAFVDKLAKKSPVA